MSLGTSGAGRSSLLTTLAPDLDARGSEASDPWGKGKHTTTRWRIYGLAGCTRLIGPQGIREFGL